MSTEPTKPKKPTSPKLLAALAKARKARAAKRSAGAAPTPSTGTLGDNETPHEHEPKWARGFTFVHEGSAGQNRTVFHRGDIGDCIAALPVVRAMGGAHFVVGPPPAGEPVGTGPGFCRESMEGARFDALKPLLEAQPYIFSVRWSAEGCPENAVDFSRFRSVAPVRGENLTSWQARAVGWYNVDTKPWLTVDGGVGWIGGGPAVFARSARHQNPTRMPWKAILDKHTDGVFVGLESEHRAFQAMAGRPVPWERTDGLLDVARVMVRAERVFCNQSAPWWVALGLGCPGVLEVCPDMSVQNSIIERDELRFIGTAEQAGKGRNWL